MKAHSLAKYALTGALFLFILFLAKKMLISAEPFATALEYSRTPLLWTAGNEAHPKDNYAREDILLNDSYPLIWHNLPNMKDQWQKWWHYPTFKVGSYQQITNNIRYPNNPDIATCTRGEFCGALYHNAQYKSNVTQPIAPVAVDVNKVRVNYYNTAPNMLPFVANGPNVLY